MPPQTSARHEPAHPVQTIHKLQDLDAIFHDETDAVIWERPTPPSVLSALNNLPTHQITNGRFCVPASAVGRCVADTFNAWGFDAEDARRWLIADIETLARHMARILSSSNLLIRIEVVRDDACRKFHRDTVKARLICTYNGPGTEFGVSNGNGCADDIKNAPTGGPILLKGKLWPGSPSQTVLHRSPPIAGADTSRLVIVLNEAC
ncbi:MAG: DUF1826 domain-containing protein [Pseudomonadota bacterium]